MLGNHETHCFCFFMNSRHGSAILKKKQDQNYITPDRLGAPPTQHTKCHSVRVDSVLGSNLHTNLHAHICGAFQLNTILWYAILKFEEAANSAGAF